MHRIALNVARRQARSSSSSLRTGLHGLGLEESSIVSVSRYARASRQLSSTAGARAQAPKQPPPPRPRKSGTNNKHLPPELDNIGIPPSNFSKPTLTALNFWYRFAKFSFIGLAIFVSGAFVAFEGTHYYIEHVALAPHSDEDADGEKERWGWLKEGEESWTGGREKGGTDPALSAKARYALRAAWMTEHWGTGVQVISANTQQAATTGASGDQKAVEARLEYGHDFLALALALALESEKAGKPLRRETISEIMLRKARTLERMGSRGALYDARATYERVWDRQAKLNTTDTDTDANTEDTEEKARLALKLGDLNARLGDIEGATTWWARSLSLASSSNSDLDYAAAPDDIALPSRLPSSPHAQRTIAATLSSLSAFYAQSGRLADAKTVEDTGLALLSPSSLSSGTSSTIATATESDSEPKSLKPASPSPSQRLHDLFLQHRASLLALHRAEVGHVFYSSSTQTQTLEELAKAAVEAEDIAFSLTSSPSLPSPSSAHLNTESSISTPAASPAPAHKATLDDTYDKDRTLKGPASSLLRDARRTALHAWTLSGILHENAASASASSPSSTSTSSSWKKLLPSSPRSESGAEAEFKNRNRDAERKAALRCYARALAWAGAPASRPGLESAPDRGPEPEPEPGRDLLESEWRTLWEGYTRTRDAVLASATAGAVAVDENAEEKRKKE